MIDYLGDIKGIAKFGSDWFYGGASPHVGEMYNFRVFYCPVRRSVYRPRFATDFDVLWLKRFGLAQGCAF